MLKKMFLVILVCLIAGVSFSQPSPVSAEKVYKDWQVFANTTNMVEIFYCIVKCNGVNKVQLMVYNDGVADTEIDISLEIQNSADKKSFTVKKKFQAQKGVFHKAVCDNDTNSELKITLPDTYNPSDILVRQVL